MNILAIDASQRSFSLCLRLQGQSVVPGAECEAKIEHLPALLQELLARYGLAPAQLDALSLIKGPGSYTGLRGSLLVARSLAMTGVKVMTRQSLEVLHYEAGRLHKGPVLAAVSVRQDQYYFSLAEGNNLLQAPQTASAANLLTLQKQLDCPVTGDWPEANSAGNPLANSQPAYQLKARNLAEILAEWTETEFCPVPPDSLVPFYIRPAVMPAAGAGAAQS
jgi:tRNA threonylcarbamoyl adenosine modification protein YeaZ